MRSRCGPELVSAKWAAAQLQKVYPGFTVQSSARVHWSDDPTFSGQFDCITEGLPKRDCPRGISHQALLLSSTTSEVKPDSINSNG